MKTRTIVAILILVLSVLIIVGSCATRRKVISIDDASEIRSGNWVNEHYRNEQMAVFYPDGRYEVYDTPQQEKLYSYGTSVIYESWRDSEDVLWYRAQYKNNTGQEGYVLGKISNSDNMLEFISTTNNLVIEEWKIGEVGYNYQTYYRKK